MSHNTYRPRVELYVRSLCPAGASQEQNHTVDQLQALADQDRLSDLSIYVWGDRIAPETARKTEEGQRLLDRIAAFKHWERETDASLDGFRWQHDVTNLATDESFSVIALPTMALSEFDNNTIQHVTPCTRDGQSLCVSDRVAKLTALPGAAESSGPNQMPTSQGSQ
ncbi:MAG: HTH domain-containing protein [Haloarcula sp.]